MSREPAAFDAALLELYDDFDRATAEVAPVCRASGRCCDFEAFGHTLFASRSEVEFLVARADPVAFEPGAKLCPWWHDRRCTARAPRPLGCRAFFCDPEQEEAMQALHERFLGRLKGLHEAHGRPWDYRPFLHQLERMTHDEREI